MTGEKFSGPFPSLDIDFYEVLRPVAVTVNRRASAIAKFN
jgi:hypothetical protein